MVYMCVYVPGSVWVIESAGIPGQFVCKRRKQEIYEFRIVENAMNISPHAGGVHVVTIGRAVLQKIQGRIGSTFHRGGHSHMDFIALHEWRMESGRWRMGIAQTELHLAGHLLSRHAGTDEIGRASCRERV